MARTLRLVFLLSAAIATCALVLAGQGGAPAKRVSSPEATLAAFAKAMENRDFKSMAGLVLGGDTTFDYRQLFGKDKLVDTVYAKVISKIWSVTIVGGFAEVEGSLDYRSPVSGGGGTGYGVMLYLDHGDWRIAPYLSRYGVENPRYGGGDLADYINLVRNPEAILTRREPPAPVRNHSEQTIKLGMERTKFLDQVLNLPMPGGPDEYPPYSGYRFWLFDRTTMLWPVGRSDEVVFYLAQGGAGVSLTCWRRVGPKPKRMWQVALPKGRSNGGKPLQGTLAHWLAKQGACLPKKMPKDMVKGLRAVRTYAVYQVAMRQSVFTCRVVSKDGTEKSGTAKFYSPEAVNQNDSDAEAAGLFITPDEVPLLKPVASSGFVPADQSRQERAFITDPNRLGQLRSTLGEPDIPDDPVTFMPSPIWSATNINYDTRQIFPIGRADERLYLNVMDPGGTAYLALETKHGGKIRKEWYITFRSVKERSSIPAKELRSMGTLEAFLAREGLQPLLPKNHAQAQRIRKVLKAKESFATYFTSAHMGGPMYCGHIDVDGSETQYWLVKDEDVQGGWKDFPVTGFPYRITEFERKEIRARIEQRRKR
ncbi:MAG: hypothetical protein ACHQ50_15235 [Fimbriimonadales bacterium]